MGSHLAFDGWYSPAESAALLMPACACRLKGIAMLLTILVVILIIALLGGLPTWGYSRSWGYGPSGGIGVILLILLVLWLLGVF